MEVGGERHVLAALTLGKDSTSHGRGDWTNPIDQLFLNRRAAARYRALASIIPGRERFSWNLSFLVF